MGILDFIKGQVKGKAKPEIGAILPIFLWRDINPFLHIIHPNYFSFYLRCSRKYQKPIILAFFRHFSKFVPPLPNSEEIENFIIPPYVYII